jgi:hypothetical protein
VIAIVGVAVLIGILLAWPMRACSVSGGDVACMVIDFRNVLVESCFGTSFAKIAFDGRLDELESTDFTGTEVMIYVAKKRLSYGV